MGITTKTLQYCYCDLCNKRCGPADTRIVIEVYPGDGRDVGPGYLHGELKLDIPYGVSNGIVCKDCKIEWLRAYLEQEAP